MAIIDIMAGPQTKAKASSDGRQPLTKNRSLTKDQPLTKTQLRQNAKPSPAKQSPAAQRPSENHHPPESSEVIDFYPDIHEAVEDILFDISQEPLLGDPRLDRE